MTQALIRATHPYAFRSGKWAQLTGTALMPGYPDGDRLCYLVRFPDGEADFWIIDDDAEPADYQYCYEFLMTGDGQVVTLELARGLMEPGFPP